MSDVAAGRTVNNGRRTSRSPYLKTSYESDLQLFDYTGLRVAAIALIVAGVLAFPALISGYSLNILNLALISVLGAVALQLLTGVAGQLSLGHAAFLAAGAFTGGALFFHLHVPFIVALIGGAAMAGLLGLLVAIPSVKLKGLYLAVTTMALHFVVIVLGREYQLYLQDSFGTTSDITLPNPSLGAFSLDTRLRWYYLLVAVIGLFLGVSANLMRSPFGRAWIAVRDRDIAAEAVGVNVRRYKYIIFTFSSALAGVTGVLWAYYIHVVNIENYKLFLSVKYLAMIIIGGLGSLLGAVLGALFVSLLPEVISYAIEAMDAPFYIANNKEQVEVAVFGVFIILFLIFEPEGLAGIWRRIKTYFLLWPLKYRPLEGGRRR